jgi:hypothetical protein
MSDQDYFLSKSNPIATTDQCEAEEAALRLIRRPEVVKAREWVEQMLGWVLGVDIGGQIADLPSFAEEYVFHYAMRAANSDPNFPKIVRFMAPPHSWFGRDLPGSRWAGDSPDFIYRTIAVGHGNSYVIRGKATCATPPSVNYALMDDRAAAPTIMGLLDSLDMEFESNGDFAITIDPSPANGRPNHIQTRPGAWQIWIRDALGDWSSQSCNQLRVEMLSPPTRGPLSEDEMADRAAKHAMDGVYYYYYLLRTSFLQPKNHLRPPISSHSLGGMKSQFTCSASIQIADDEAVVITASHSGARFRNAVMTDPYARTVHYWDRMTSLNSAQMKPDADGNHTYVCSHRDPGVHNWLDCCGMPMIKFGQRWQAFDRSREAETPTIASKVIKLADLEAHLPAGVARIDAEGRKAQIAERLEGFEQRFIDR